MKINRLSILLSLLQLLTACGKSDDIEQTATTEQPSAPSDYFNRLEYVDLGLPSGTLWASKNVGAFSPADYGAYFAWGETVPKAIYNWTNYKWYDNHYKFTKYNISSSHGTIDNKTQLDAEDDAATANRGNGWRMPTTAELQELSNTTYCIWIWTTRINSKGEAINGYDVMSKSNGNIIFLPAAGYYHLNFPNVGRFCFYWSSSLASDYPYDAYYLSSTPGFNLHLYRKDGLPVQPLRASAGE